MSAEKARLNSVPGLCLPCRALLRTSTTCTADDREHLVVANSPHSRFDLFELWKTSPVDALRFPMSRLPAVRSFFVGTMFASALVGAYMAKIGQLAGLGAAATITAGSLFLAVKGFSNLSKALQLDVLPRTRPVAAGTVLNGSTVRSAARGTPCIAYVTAVMRPSLLLYEGGTGGFDIRLDDSRIVRIPSGDIRLALSVTECASIDRARMKKWMIEAGFTATDLARIETLDRPSIELHSWPTCIEGTIAEGDRLEVIGPLQGVADHAARTTYRTSASVLQPRGVPLLRLVRRAPSNGESA